MVTERSFVYGFFAACWSEMERCGGAFSLNLKSLSQQAYIQFVNLEDGLSYKVNPCLVGSLVWHHSFPLYPVLSPRVHQSAVASS